MARRDHVPTITMQLPVDQTGINESFPGGVPASVGRPDLVAVAQRVSPGILGSFTGPDTISYGGNDFRLSLNENGSLVWELTGSRSFPGTISPIPGGTGADPTGGSGGGGAGSGGGTAGGGGGAPGSAPGDPTRSAEALIRAKLEEYGIGGLSGFALDMLRQGYGWDYILLQMRDSQIYKDRFKGMEMRRAAGHAAISEADYIAYERGLTQLFREVGMPAEFNNRDYFAQLIGKDVSYREVTQRVTEGYQRALNTDPSVLNQLEAMYGVDRGKLAAFFLDPKKTNDAILREFAAARLSGAGVQTGFGALTKREAEGLVRSGITDDQGRQGLSDLAADSPLFTDLPGGGIDPAISRNDQLNATFRGSNRAKRRIEDRRRSRLSGYGGGGSLAGSQGGLSALGSSRA